MGDGRVAAMYFASSWLEIPFEIVPVVRNNYLSAPGKGFLVFIHTTA